MFKIRKEKVYNYREKNTKIKFYTFKLLNLCFDAIHDFLEKNHKFILLPKLLKNQNKPKTKTY